MKLFLKLVCLTAVAIIGPMSNTGRAGDRPTEEVAFYYNKIAFQYATQAVPSGVTFGDSGYEALPADFFGPGSLPFEGSIPLQRAPELTAMVIERNANNPPPPPPPPPPSGEKGGTEDINIGVGELQECSAIDPIVVNFSNGSTELWDVTVNINSHGPSGGWLRVTHNDPGDGGTIVPVDSFFDVFLDITFSNTPAGSATRHRFFAVIDRTQLNPSVHHPDFLSAPRHNSIGGGEDRAFIPGADPENPSAPLQVLLFEGRGIELPLVVVDVVPEPSSLVLMGLASGWIVCVARRGRAVCQS